MKPIIFMFSGQGSHYYHMGRELFEQHTVFKQCMQTGDAIYQEITGFSLLNVLYNQQYKKSDPFTRTLLTHPAIFITEYALGQLLLAQGITPDYVLGTSLGEFAAAVFAGILPFETALKTVIVQAQLLEEKCAPGSMLAILHSQNLYHGNTLLHESSELAAVNFNSHFVVSGNPENLSKIEIYLKEQGINFQRLAVTHGFHSSYIDPAANSFLDFIAQQSIKTATLPFIACVHAKSLTTPLPAHFWDIIRLPIQFQLTIQALESSDNYFYLDVGPAGTLATFVKYNVSPDSASKAFSLLTPYSQDSLNLTNLSNFLHL